MIPQNNVFITAKKNTRKVKAVRKKTATSSKDDLTTQSEAVVPKTLNPSKEFKKLHSLYEKMVKDFAKKN